MRLAFISTILDYPWGGADTLWTRAAEAAHTRGDRLLISVSPAVAKHPRVTALIDGGAEAVIRDQPPTSPSLGARLQRKLGLTRSPEAGLVAALQSFRPDLVIFSCGATYDLAYFPVWADWLLASRTPFRVIANWQAEQPDLPPTEIERILHVFPAADALCFVSTRNLTVTRRHLGRPLPNARVIQNPLRWQPADVAPWPAGPGARLATVSRLDESKGVQLLLQALVRAGRDLPDDWQLNIYGQGPYEPQLRAAAGPLGRRVQFRGHVSQLHSIWAENHLMVSPALDDGVPMTIPEAMLCQRPVLATCVGGAEDWLAPGRTGFLCPTPDAGALAATLREAFAARAQWEAMGHAAAIAATGRYQAHDYLQLIAP